jgi:hypothetical protein
MHVIDSNRLREISNRDLSVGTHIDPNDGMCIMEAVAYVVGEPFTDRPVCVSSVLAEAARTANDKGGLYTRRCLKERIVKLIGTGQAALDAEIRRACRIADCAVRVLAPMTFDRFGLKDCAIMLRGLEKIVDANTASVAASASVHAAHAAHDAHDVHAAAHAAAAAAASAAAASVHAAHAAAHATASASAAAHCAAYTARVADYHKVWDLFFEAFDDAIEIK